MSLVYAVEYKPGAGEVAELFRRSGIRRPVDDSARIALMIEHANLIVTARDEGRLVGIARALTDFSFCCYLSDLAVDREYQRSGIGGRLVRMVQEAIGEQAMLLLLAAPEAMEYYPKLGFQAVGNGWIIPRRH